MRDYVIGRLGMQRAGIHEALHDACALAPPERIDLQLVEGPFKTLDGVWSFEPIQDRGTKVSLQMRFEFANALLNLLLVKTFEKNCSQFVDAFVHRAREVYDGK